MRYGFGIDVGGTTIKLAYFDQEGNMLDKWEIPTNTANNGEAVLPDIAAAVRAYLDEKKIPDADIIGIGVGVPGPVSDEGIVNKCVNLGWGVVDLHGELGKLTGFGVKGGNDANVAALGESWQGGGKGYGSMVFVTLGTGIGGGIVLDGKILEGAHGAAGEVGHVTLDRNETEPCGCGKFGCAEEYGSATGIVRIARRYLASHDTPSPLRDLEVITARDVFDHAKAGDQAALGIVDRVYDDLGVFLAGICCIIDPEVVVIGGGVSNAGPILLDGIRPYFTKYMFHTGRNIPFALATLGNDAGIYGAVKMILD